MTKTDENLDMKELHLLAAARNLVDLMHRWNRLDLHELVIEDSRNETPYYHVTTGLWKILLLLGVKKPNSKMDFYDMVSTGMTPIEAIERIRENESGGDV